jgi:hypothetical protein
LPEVRELKNWIARIAWRVAISRKRKVAEVSLEETEMVATQMRSLATGAEENCFTKRNERRAEKTFRDIAQEIARTIDAFNFRRTFGSGRRKNPGHQRSRSPVMPVSRTADFARTSY